jgi:hypothetical protein
LQLLAKLSVDDSHAALEIISRSSYVPVSLRYWRLIPECPVMRAWSMIRKSGHRSSEKIMLKTKKVRHLRAREYRYG